MEGKSMWSNLNVIGVNTAYMQRIHKGLEKLYDLLFENHIDKVDNFDLLLLYSFVVIFIAFIIASIVAVFEEDQRSLQEIKSKVKASTTVIANLASTLWTIRETSLKSITYEGYLRIMKNKQSIKKLQQEKPIVEIEKEPEEKPAIIKKSPPKKHFATNLHKSVKTLRGKELQLPSSKVSFLPKLGRTSLPKKISSLNISTAKSKLRASTSSSSVRQRKIPSKLIIKKT